MTPVFLDTSFLIASVMTDDALHPRAVAWRRRLKCRFVVTEFVLVEFSNALAHPRHRPIVGATVRGLASHAMNLVIPATSDLLARGLTMFEARSDKEWSLTDCTSFVVMQDQRCEQALTFDHHFEQAGFHALLRGDPA